MPTGQIGLNGANPGNGEFLNGGDIIKVKGTWITIAIGNRDLSAQHVPFNITKNLIIHNRI